MKTAITENGLFEVNDIGEVYRIKSGRKELAVQVKAGRNGRYRVVAVKIAEARQAREIKPNAQTKKEAERLKRKLNKNALKIADAKELISSIEAENAAITQHIESLLGTRHDQATA